MASPDDCQPDPCDPCAGCGPFAAQPGPCATQAPTGRDAACEPGPWNDPVTDAQYQCSLGVRLQTTVDSARRISHQLGLRPYRVRLIWAQRDTRERFQVIDQIELTPVRVDAVEDVGYDLGIAGRQLVGDLVISQVSPAQVREYQLRGKMADGQDPPDDVEFFYELERLPRCQQDAPIAPQRYTPIGKPGFDAPGYQWIVRLAAQQNPRGPEGQYPDRDNAFQPQRVPPVPGLPRFRR